MPRLEARWASPVRVLSVAVVAAGLAITWAGGDDGLPSTVRGAAAPRTVSVPVLFEPDGARFSARSAGLTVALGAEGAWIAAGDESLRMYFAGGEAVRPAGEGAAAVLNSFTGPDPANWRRVPLYEAVRYDDVYPKTDVVYHARGGRLEFDLEVAPGGDPGDVALAFEGHDSVRLEEGELVVSAGGQELRLGEPFAYQVGEGLAPVHAQYALRPDGTVGFLVDHHDPAMTLVIDPTVTYGSYVGGSGQDWGEAVGIDGDGKVYVAVSGSSSDFPTGGPAGMGDVYVLKLDPQKDGAASLVYATRLGGPTTPADVVDDLFVDEAGDAYLVGRPSPGFPVLNGFDDTADGSDLFVAKLDATGSLTYATYLGGSGPEGLFGGFISLHIEAAITADEAGNILVTGSTKSADFPLKNPLQASLNTSGQSACSLDPFGCSDLFLTKIDPAQSGAASLIYSTLIGGAASEVGTGVAAGPDGTILVTGYSQSPGYPTTGDAYQASLAAAGDCAGNEFACPDVVVTQVDPAAAAGAQLVYSSFLGGTDTEGDWLVGGALPDEPHARIDYRDGLVVVTGQTKSDDFPTTPNAYMQERPGGPSDAFLAVLDLSGDGAQSLVYSTYLGGSYNEAGQDVQLRDGLAYVTGFTGSADFPVAPGALQAQPASRPVYRSTDGGSSWSGASGGLPASAFVQGTPDVAIAVDPSDPQRVFYAGDAAGLYRSSNAGVTWTPLDLPPQVSRVLSVAISPANGMHVLAGTDRGVYVSGDGGVTWEAGHGFHAQAAVYRLVFNPGDPDVVYAGVGFTFEPDVYRSADGGQTWQALDPEGNGRTLAMAPGDPDVLYLAAQTPALSYPVLRSDDGGVGWDEKGGIPFEAGPVYTLLVDPLDPMTVYAGVANGVQKSTDGGQTWSDASLGLPLQGDPPSVLSVNSLAAAPGAPGLLLAASSVTESQGGVFRSTDGGESWSPAVSGLPADDVEQLAAADAGGSAFYAAVVSGDDAFISVIDPHRSGAASLVSSTYFGGGDHERPDRIVVDAAGVVYVVGTTESPDLPAGGFQQETGGLWDAFVAVLGPSGQRPGDVDCDGTADEADVLLMLSGFAGLAGGECAGPGGDADCNGVHDTEDALAVLRSRAGLGVLPAACPGDG